MNCWHYVHHVAHHIGRKLHYHGAGHWIAGACVAVPLVFVPTPRSPAPVAWPVVPQVHMLPVGSGGLADLEGGTYLGGSGNRGFGGASGYGGAGGSLGGSDVRGGTRGHDERVPVPVPAPGALAVLPALLALALLKWTRA